ncbi:cilia- and flagella-associated protein 53 [Mantella aurantiaca]
MMMLSQRNRPLRCREVTGPTPHSVAVKAKFPSARPHDHMTLERRKRDDFREQMLVFTKENDHKDLMSKWELITDHKILHNTVQRKVNETMEEYHLQIEERRDRLKALLETEELKYIQEMESMEETTLERQAKMRERARSLRDKREKERLALVAEKRDQQFREQCEELRTLKSRMHQTEVCTERMAQLVLKEELEKQRKEEENLFAELWERDRLAKVENEEKKTQKQKELNREMLDVLQAQRAAAEGQKMEEKRLKEEEAHLLAEQRKLMKLEDERAVREKQQKQSQVRNMLDHSVRLKMKRLARDQQEELALDMKIMDQIMQDTHDDTKEKQQRKLELQKEQQIYRQYLAQQLEEEKRQEREMDKLIETELEKSWAKRAAQMKLEKEARNRLMKDVMDSRKLQIQEKLERNAREQEELSRDKELLEKAVAEHKQLETERNARKVKAAQQYQQQLLSQVTYQRHAREAEKAEERREYESGLQAETSYQQKLHDILSRPYIRQEHIHPLRRTRLSSPNHWLPQ